MYVRVDRSRRETFSAIVGIPEVERRIHAGEGVASPRIWLRGFAYESVSGVLTCRPPLGADNERKEERDDIYSAARP